jgi:hypothetical protein
VAQSTGVGKAWFYWIYIDRWFDQIGLRMYCLLFSPFIVYQVAWYSPSSFIKDYDSHLECSERLQLRVCMLKQTSLPLKTNVSNLVCRTDLLFTTIDNVSFIGEGNWIVRRKSRPRQPRLRVVTLDEWWWTVSSKLIYDGRAEQ